MKRSFLFLFACLFIMSCEKENPGPVEMLAEPLFATGEAYGEPLPERQFFNFTTGNINPNSPSLQAAALWQDSIVETEAGPAIFTGAISKNMPGRLLFGFEFWPENLDDNFGKAEVEQYFQSGRRFDFGRGPGKVDVLASLFQGDGTLMEKPSRASFMAPQFEAAGSLYIETVEDHTYESPAGGLIPGKRIRCSFLGLLGHYAVHEAIGQGATDISWGELKINIEGTAEFFIAYP